MKKNEFRNFVGIDISKKTFDAVFIFNNEINKSVHQHYEVRSNLNLSLFEIASTEKVSQ
jgi:hypothetical protein